MSRTFVAACLLLFVAACTDQTEPVDRPSDPVAGDEPVASDLELGNTTTDRSAHTALSGGATTVFDQSENAFSLPAPTLAAASLARHDEGDEGFEDAFTEAGPEHPGLGPVFDNTSCEGCHEGDGRGRPPVGTEDFTSFLFRASVAGKDAHGGPAPVPGFGGQLQTHAISTILPEISASISYSELPGRFADGTRFSLRAPTYDVTGTYAPLPAGTLISPRSAPVVFGLGLLEAVPEAVVLGLSDPSDRDRDGISGRANMVFDPSRDRTVLGRFGWKANTANLLVQAAGAYNGDMGVTSSIFPAESCEGAYPECAAHPVEVDDETVGAVAFYTQTLGVPARRSLNDPRTSRGEVLFGAIGCAGCHIPTLRTGQLRGVPEVSNQTIHPYTDLLLHDMGPGLADNRPDFLASGSEWRTPPLWGIGLVQVVNGHTNFLHDGRARSLLEAVLWHGGESKRAADRVRRLSRDDRAALIAFLESL
jgi:CxxC motif-containing protein (DUF1111 family)